MGVPSHFQELVDDVVNVNVGLSRIIYHLSFEFKFLLLYIIYMSSTPIIIPSILSI